MKELKTREIGPNLLRAGIWSVTALFTNLVAGFEGVSGWISSGIEIINVILDMIVPGLEDVQGEDSPLLAKVKALVSPFRKAVAVLNAVWNAEQYLPSWLRTGVDDATKAGEVTVKGFMSPIEGILAAAASGVMNYAASVYLDRAEAAQEEYDSQQGMSISEWCREYGGGCEFTEEF